MATHNKNLVSDYSAPTDGSSDTVAAWLLFTTFLSGLSAGDVVNLTVPEHTYQFIATGSTDGAIYLCPGVLGGITVNIEAEGAGATFSDNGGAGHGFFIGGHGLPNDNTVSARIASVDVGATQCRLLTPSQHSRFSVGRWMQFAGIDMQGFGTPLNPAFLEYVKITGKDTVTGIITFDRPLQNRYLSTWPVYNSGGAFQQDLGGAATIYAMPVGWDVTINYRKITFDMDQQVYVTGKSIAVIDGGVPDGSDGIVPSSCMEATFDGVSQTDVGLELDKNVQTLSYLNGCTMRTMTCQSRSVVDLIIDDMNFSVSLNGSGRRTVLTNSTCPTVTIGPTSYGNADSFESNNNIIATTIGGSNRAETGIVAKGYTMSGGVIRIARSYKAVPFAVPGAWCYFKGSGVTDNYNNMFQVLSVQDDGVNTIITTSATGGFPTVPNMGSGLDIVIHPCPVWNGSGNSGSAFAVDLNNDGAQGKPIFSYSKRNYTGGTISTAPSFRVWGQIGMIKATVSQAYTGSQGSLISTLIGAFGGKTISEDRTTATFYNPRINLRTAGVRTVLSGSVSGNVLGDILGSGPGNIWFSGTQDTDSDHDVSAEVGSDPTKDFALEVEIVSDQGMVDHSLGFPSEASEASDGLAFHSDHAPVKHYAKLNKVDTLVRRVAPELIPEPTILPRDFFEDVPKKKRRFTIADGFSDA